MFVREAALYPPLRQFAAGIGESGLREAIARSNDDPIPKDITLAVVIPRSRGAAREADLARLHRELDALARRIDRDRGIAELIVDASGTELPLRELPWTDLLGAIERQFYVGPRAARTILAKTAQCDIEPQDIGALKAAGFNRLALAAARIDPRVVETARRGGFDTIAVTIDGERPQNQSPGLKEAVEILVSVHPERLEIRAPAPDFGPDEKGDGSWRDSLVLAGYAFIGPDQYALDTDELALGSQAGCLRFGVFGYTSSSDCDLIGVGPEAFSQVGDCLARNASGLVEWRQAIDAGRLPALQGVILTDEDRIRDAVMQSLLCQRMIPVRRLEASFGIVFRLHFAPELARLSRLPAATHLCDYGDHIEVRSPAWPWLRTMARCFDAYTSRQMPRREAAEGH